jgi:hypothetical protein
MGARGHQQQTERPSRAWAAAAGVGFRCAIVADGQRGVDMVAHGDAHSLDFHPKAMNNPEVHQECHA